MRLAKYLAHAGVASRRSSEEIIRSGAIQVNGKTIKDPAFSVSEEDNIFYRGTPLKKESHVYYLFHKPAGVTTSLKDRHAEETITSYLKNISARVVPVGRLDKDSTGLLLVTNDGELTHRLTHPRFEILKTYEVCATGEFTEIEFRKMREGVKSDGDTLKVRSVEILKQLPGKTTLIITLGEGKKREIRRMLEALGRKTISLKRVQMGPVRLGGLKSGGLRKLTDQEVNDLKKSVKLI